MTDGSDVVHFSLQQPGKLIILAQQIDSGRQAQLGFLRPTGWPERVFRLQWSIDGRSDFVERRGDWIWLEMLIDDQPTDESRRANDERMVTGMKRRHNNCQYPGIKTPVLGIVVVLSFSVFEILL
jgi:hypothetical protein